MERLTPDDAAFLHLEDEISAMHNVTVAVFEGPEPPFEQLRDRLAGRVALVPRLRQRVVGVPFRLERPVWVDDPQFSLDYHLRHTGLPQASDLSALRNLVGRLLSQRLDRGKPLWEMWVVSGLPDDRWAIISKAHHAMMDGVSGTDPLALAIDQTRTRVGAGPLSNAWAPDPIPSDQQLLADASSDLLFDLGEQYRLARRLATRPVRRLMQAFSEPTAAEISTGLVGALGPHRRWCSASVDLDLVRDARQRLDVSTNDVILGLVSAGFRAMLEAGRTPVPHSIQTLVPLAVASGEFFINEVTALEAELPVGEPSLDRAIHALAAQTHPSTDRAVAGSALTELRGLAAPTLCALGVRTATRKGVRSGRIQTVTINAPGSRDAVTLLDRPLLRIIPAIPLVAKVRISVGAMSYMDNLYFGITGDRDAAPEIEALAAGIEEASEALRS